MTDKYGSEHRWRRRQYARMMRNNGGYPCARCKQQISVGEPWHLGHPDGETLGGPEHVSCNVSAPARLRKKHNDGDHSLCTPSQCPVVGVRYNKDISELLRKEQRSPRMELTRDQERAVLLIDGHDYRSGPLTICGYAGTGKSYLAANIIPEIFAGKRLVYAAPTNKAARKVLRGSLEKAGLDVSNFPHGGGKKQHDNEYNEYVDEYGCNDEHEDRFTDPLSVGTVFALLNLPKEQTICESTKEPCREGGWCKTHRQLQDSDKVPEPCLLTEGPLLSDPRAAPLSGAEVVVIDEVSMLSRNDYAQLYARCAERQIPLILFGDPGQLPPVGEDYPSALASPDIVLEEPHRQAKGDPIIYLATLARHGYSLNPGSYGLAAHVLPPDLGRSMLAANSYFARHAADGDMIICPRHDGYRPGGRVWHNNQARAALGFTSPWPVPGDVVVSMSNDYYLWRAFNGSRGIVLEASEPFHLPDRRVNGVQQPGELVIEMTVDFDFSRHRDPRRFLALARQFGWPGNGSPGGKKAETTVPLRQVFRDELAKTNSARPRDLTPKERKMLDDGKEPLLRLDYGYALTAWKAQGDEARGVLVTGAYDYLPHVRREAYLYTAITRAKKELAIG